MDGQGLQLFELADRRLAWAQHRQELLARNIANANTPGWKARDLKPFAAALGAATVVPLRTDPAHLPATRASPASMELKGERSPDGNSVKLDEQLMRVAETETTNTMVANIYTKYLGLFRLALGR